ncbi:hypothetical protein CN692_14260 [Bacillus sp. AFS002410]|uniref:hypothetical protein n=1 Tax=Bacillus sp. AFS002410 TaxID=2033481 RepID=UPI000BF1081C|nr:hypothetical protein [Bacillus sp. AFS002410]PEJ57058.1 hypothetical protein CN692_14260 [Bacillus sp. AFS002410]
MNKFEEIEIYGEQIYYRGQKKMKIREYKKAKLSQSEALEELNIWLKSEGQKPNTISFIKHNWNK